MIDEIILSQSAFEWALVSSIGLYLIGVLWFLSGMRNTKGTNSQQPFVSIIVAARDEEEYIGLCLASLLRQDYPQQQYEIIVVDDGSQDETARIVESLQADSAHVHLLRRNPGGSKKAALALALEMARGPFVLTTDADCQVDPGWVSGMIAHFGEDVGMVIGFSQIGFPNQKLSFRSGFEAVDFLNLMACIWGSAGRGHSMAASGQNMAYRRAAFDQVGGDEESEE